MRLLLTGFEPFGGSSINPSQEVVRVLAQQPPPGLDLHTAILPVDHMRGPEALLRAIEGARPEAVLCLGEAGRRVALSLERVAVNLIDDSIADNAGECRAARRPISPPCRSKPCSRPSLKPGCPPSCH